MEHRVANRNHEEGRETEVGWPKEAEQNLIKRYKVYPSIMTVVGKIKMYCRRKAIVRVWARTSAKIVS